MPNQKTTKKLMAFNYLNYKFSTGQHRDKNVIFVNFTFSTRLKDELKNKFPTAKWSTTLRCWYLPDVKSIRIEIGIPAKTEPCKATQKKFIRLISPLLNVCTKHSYSKPTAQTP